MKIFMLDNYDSFTYNLVQYFQILGCDVTARRCDCTTVDAVFALRPDAIVLSPGPAVQKAREFCSSSSARDSHAKCRCSASASDIRPSAKRWVETLFTLKK